MIKAGQKFGRLTVKGIRKFVDSKGRTRTVALCRCKCGNRCERDASALESRPKIKSSCGCFDTRQVQKDAVQERQARLRSTLTLAELDQVNRILAERVTFQPGGEGQPIQKRPRRPNETDRLDAIDCVIADRAVGEMACHQGSVWTI